MAVWMDVSMDVAACSMVASSLPPEAAHAEASGRTIEEVRPRARRMSDVMMNFFMMMSLLRYWLVPPPLPPPELSPDDPLDPPEPPAPPDASPAVDPPWTPPSWPSVGCPLLPASFMLAMMPPSISSAAALAATLSTLPSLCMDRHRMRQEARQGGQKDEGDGVVGKA